MPRRLLYLHWSTLSLSLPLSLPSPLPPAAAKKGEKMFFRGRNREKRSFVKVYTSNNEKDGYELGKVRNVLLRDERQRGVMGIYKSVCK